jgi:hypothetical protein
MTSALDTSIRAFLSRRSLQVTFASYVAHCTRFACYRTLPASLFSRADAYKSISRLDKTRRFQRVSRIE